MTVRRFRIVSTIFVSALSINSALALPIDWNGVFGVDTHMIQNYRRDSGTVNKPWPGPATEGNPTPGPRTGTQAIANGDNEAVFQTYILRLNPHIIVNDGVALKGELSSGYIRGGFAGDNSANNADGSGNNSYFFTTPAQNSALKVNQMYMELYADSALVKIGRMSRHYGMGMVFDDGSQPWDRFFTMYDGIEAKMTIGNFSLIPHYAKISSSNDESVAEGSPASGAFDVRELGVVAKYDNRNKDLIASVLYAKRSSERKNVLYNATSPTADFRRGSTEVTVIEPYLSKKWNKFVLSAEASLQTGDYGSVYDPAIKSKLDAAAYVVQASYEFNPKWDAGILAGQVSGDKGSSDKFEATYLHPNFHIADLMFRYNYPAFNEGNRSIFDASIANSQFLKVYGNYKTDKWVWKGAFVFAKALQTAKAGARSYHHEESYAFTSTADQADDLGYELDFGFDYHWNPNVTIGGYYGYWFVGDYFAFSNDPAGELSIDNVHGGGLRATLEF